MSSGAILEVRGAVHSFGGVRAVDAASFAVAPRSITSLIGPNGAGKSTLFNIVSGFIRGEAGVVLLEGREIQHLAPHRIAGAGLVRTFQTARVLSRLSVLDNVVLAAAGHPGERVSSVLLRRRAAREFERAARARAGELLRLVRLERHSDDYAGTLSGGQRKLLDFARALMVEPRVLLLDEPMAGVSPPLRAQLLEHILQLRDELGMTFVLVEHDLDVVMRASDRIVVMNSGAVIAEGTPDEIRGNQRVVDAYLGARP